MPNGLSSRHVPALVRAFELGSGGTLSEGPVASGRLGSIWRLDTDSGSWAIKQVGRVTGATLTEIEEGAAFQEAARAAGIGTPEIRRTATGGLIADLGGGRARVQGWVDLAAPDIGLDPAAVGELVGRLHRVDFAGSVGLDPWYGAPVGAPRWARTMRRLRARRAPFADELDSCLPELVALEAHLGGPLRSVRTCHRDLWADNVRRSLGPAGGVVVFDFDNAGLADPAQELAQVLVEYASHDPARAPRIRAAYTDAGGSARVDRPADFAMVIAQLAHIVEEGCRRWLASTTDAQRADNEGWVREYLDRPLSRDGIAALLATCGPGQSSASASASGTPPEA